MLEIFAIALSIIVAFCVGLWTGSTHQTDAKKVGAVIVNMDDPKKDVIRFELTVPIAEMINQKEICFSVEVDKEMPH